MLITCCCRTQVQSWDWFKVQRHCDVKLSSWKVFFLNKPTPSVGDLNYPSLSPILVTRHTPPLRYMCHLVPLRVQFDFAQRSPTDKGGILHGRSSVDLS